MSPQDNPTRQPYEDPGSPEASGTSGSEQTVSAPDAATPVATASNERPKDGRRPNDDFLAGDSESAQLMRNFDWSQTPLGLPSTWPQSLKTVVRILLTSRYAMWMSWGNEHTFFYNDAYKPTLGVKHAWALGAPAYEVWAEIWQDIGPRIERVLETGEATWEEALLLFLERSGYPEETYHTFSYSPLASDDGEITGMLCVVTEETERIIGARQLALLRDVAAALAAVQTEEEIFAALRSCLIAEPRDLPFSLIYLFEPAANSAAGTQPHAAETGDTNGVGARLALATGLPAGHHAMPALVSLMESPETPFNWPLAEVYRSGTPIVVDDLAALFPEMPAGVWEKPPTKAILIPMSQQGQDRAAGCLIAGINPYRVLEKNYEGFLGLLAGQIGASLANVRSYETERKRAEALAEIDRAKTTFFSNVSHELRTPLTLMLGPLDELLFQTPDSTVSVARETLSLVARNGQRLLKLVNTLLDFSRIEAGRVQAIFEPVDLCALTADIASAFRSAIERAQLQLVMEFCQLSEPVYLDRDMWEKILLNLLSNAFKFTFHGAITIQIEEHQPVADLQSREILHGSPTRKGVFVTVRDTGVGIPEGELAHIFDRFHRVEQSRGRTHEGSGIGLALVQELVKLHGGEVAVRSEVNQGTAFTIFVPYGTSHLPQERLSGLRSQASTAIRADTYVQEALRWLPESLQNISESSVIAEELEPSGGNRQSDDDFNDRPRVVLADDNADMRGYVRRLLQTGFDVVAVTDGQEALEAIRKRRPALVLSDVMMPNLDGFGLLKALREDPDTSTIPVVLLSARAGEEATVEGLEAGADDYLIKPFSARELLAVVKSHIELARGRQRAEEALRERQQEIEALNVRLRRAIRETHHRVKNNLQLTAAMVDMQAMEDSRSPSIEDFRHLSDQIRTLAAVHDLLTSQAVEDGKIGVISAKAVLEKLLGMLKVSAQGGTISYQVADCELPGRQANSLALLVNELVSNGIKHGNGKVEVELITDDGTASLRVRDDGPGFPSDFDAELAAHTGLTLVESLARIDLKGVIRYENRQDGSRGGQVRVEFPIATDEKIPE